MNIIDDKVSLKASEKTVLKRIKADNTTNICYTIKKTRDKADEGEMKIVAGSRRLGQTPKTLIFVRSMLRSSVIA